MGKKFGSKKRNRGWTSGLPVDSPLLGFGTVKTVPGLCKMGHKKSMCIGMKLYEMNDLGWCVVEINRLMLNEY